MTRNSPTGLKHRFDCRPTEGKGREAAFGTTPHRRPIATSLSNLMAARRIEPVRRCSAHVSRYFRTAGAPPSSSGLTSRALSSVSHIQTRCRRRSSRCLDVAFNDVSATRNDTCGIQKVTPRMKLQRRPPFNRDEIHAFGDDIANFHSCSATYARPPDPVVYEQVPCLSSIRSAWDFATFAVDSISVALAAT